MIENFKMWWIRNQYEINWFLIGYLTSDGFTQLARGNYLGTLIAWGFAYLNYIFSRRAP
jgi:hypothetical protein